MIINHDRDVNARIFRLRLLPHKKTLSVVALSRDIKYGSYPHSIILIMALLLPFPKDILYAIMVLNEAVDPSPAFQKHKNITRILLKDYIRKQNDSVTLMSPLYNFIRHSDRGIA